jgi:exopolysaccharide biosynthesis polyprenyl glycosylphosphotransferase
VLDIVVSVAVLVFLSPLLVAVWLVVKLTSSGPAFYVQERVGHGGRVFPMLKFRTMTVDAEKQTGPIWAVDKDPRCTRFGGLLRRLSIDELPQLINVLRGEMSVVGPRPERPFFVAKFSRQFLEYPHRHCVRPGLTGWAQIHGWRGNTSIAERLRCDLHYVSHQSLLLDFYILAMTPYVVLSGGKIKESPRSNVADATSDASLEMREAA